MNCYVGDAWLVAAVAPNPENLLTVFFLHPADSVGPALFESTIKAST